MSLIGTSSKVDQNAQPSGIPQHGMLRGGAQIGGPDGKLLTLHARLCELMPDAAERTKLLRAPANVEAAWHEGKMLPLLRARRKAIEGAVQRLEREEVFAADRDAAKTSSTDA